jgi:valyl-tRNA synthetase
MEKAFEPSQFEPRWYREWMRLDLFRADPADPRPPFSVVIPPPNITGKLHVGHALNATLQDVAVRWRRMQGRSVLWLPGTDHASIATQVMVERQLEAEGTDRATLGRERFLERAWRWKEEHQGEIRRQLEALGASCDWSRERFTMDEALSGAVREAFVRLHEEGLIYRAEHMISWCPRCRTALSDLEVVHKETAGKLWRVRYAMADGRGSLEVATTRPETMLGDTGVAVHPDDARHRDLVGREAILPLVGRRIPVVADEFVDPEFGTGAVKVTPAHDPNDLLVGRRHSLPGIRVIGDDGRMTEQAGPFAGMDRFEARRAVVERLESEGRLRGVEDHTSAVGTCQRCDTIIEPAVSMQWFVRVGPLAGPAVAAVEDGRVQMFPESWRKTYFEWMRNLHDWCISRQLWWGHRIPAWYCDGCPRTVVARDEPAACPGCGGALRQDPDVLDTWFSSALWPFSTLGWPEETDDLRVFYPTHLLVTAPDIVFFWVARMIMMGLKFRGKVPFSQVYFNGVVRDARGEKMSKTRGNVIDPMDLIREHGADALRFTLAALSTPGTDIPLDPNRVTGYRAFGNKLWNAARFVVGNLEDGAGRIPVPARGLGLADRWILSGISRLSREADARLEGLRFDEACDGLYHFTWHRYCDWYIELVKRDLLAGGPARDRARAVLVEVLDRLLRLLHPLIPFLTEDLYQRLPGHLGSIVVAPYPEPEPSWEDEAAERTMEWLIDLGSRVRNVRAAAGLAPGRRIRLLLAAGSDEAAGILRQHRELLLDPVRAGSIEIVDAVPEGLEAARGVAGGVVFAIPLAGLLDLDAERERLRREIDRTLAAREPHARKMATDSFRSRAPAAVVEKTRGIVRELDEKVARLRETLQALGAG